MWQKTPLTEKLGITYPIVLAPMAGGPGTPLLAASVSNAGGLGSLGAAYMKPELVRAAIQEIRRLTDRPFAVNLFIPEKAKAVSKRDLKRANAALSPYYAELGVEPATDIGPADEAFEEQLAVVIEEKVPVFSFTLGSLPADRVRDLQSCGVTVVGTATTVREGVLLAESGVDMIVGQGSEAGGHRGTFASPPERAMIGTVALIPQLVDRVGVPVLAAGGIVDGRGIVAALALGAAGVQMGTAFLTCTESGAHEAYKEAISAGGDEDTTALTRAFSGRAARGRRNRFLEEMEAHAAAVLPFPAQNALTRRIRQAAATKRRAEFMSLWSGQRAPRAPQGAAELVERLVAEVNQTLERLR